MQIEVAPPVGKTRRLEKAKVSPGSPVEYFARLLEADDRMRGKVLDVGSGPDYPEPQPMKNVLARCSQIDGVDPDPGIEAHPHLTNRWCAPFEDADVPSGTYDAIVTCNVVEHVRRPRQFMERACEVLRPGGVFYALTPHAVHPFAALSRSIELLGLKKIWSARSAHKVNPYPAYYRLNRRGCVVRSARDLPFDRLTCHYLATPQWRSYFPKALRPLPAAYDHLLGLRLQRCACKFAFVLEKTAG